MSLTKYAIEMLGFTEYPETDKLEVNFGIIKTYSLRGLVFENDCEQKQSKIASFGANCNVVIAQSINEACQSIIRY